MSEVTISSCPLCGGEIYKKWVYDCSSAADYNKGFDKIRTWMECLTCQHIVTQSYPENISEVLNKYVDGQYLAPQWQLCMHIYSDICKQIKSFLPNCNGASLLDVGCGAGELSLTAKNFGFDVTATDIRKEYTDRVSKYGINTKTESIDDGISGKYDVICMGDVIEHTINPQSVIANAVNSLNENGILWISTPDHTGAIASILGDGDPMRRVVEHIQYFSYASLLSVLTKNNLTPVSFGLSKRFIGCIEVIARKVV